MFGDAAAEPNLEIVGMGSEDEQIDWFHHNSHSPTSNVQGANEDTLGGGCRVLEVVKRLPREAPDRILFHRCMLECANEDSGGKKGARDGIASAAEREEVMRVVAVRAYIHQPICGLAGKDLPAVLWLQPRNHGEHRQQLVHQLTRALDEDCRALSLWRLVLLRAAHQNAIVGRPANTMMRRPRVAERHIAASTRLPDVRGHGLREHQVALTPLEMTTQLLEFEARRA